MVQALISGSRASGYGHVMSASACREVQWSVCETFPTFSVSALRVSDSLLDY
jgi:hypothetical protein